MLKTVETEPFLDQKMGTSGLRKKVSVFQQPNYVENFIQSIFNLSSNISAKTLVLGGDGRYYNSEIIPKIIRMAAANGFSKVMVGQNGILSTPAASLMIKKYGAWGGFIVSASHNPGGADGDCGIKYNIENGSSAPEKNTQAIFEQSKIIKHYRISDCKDIDLRNKKTFTIEKMTVEVFDPVQDYVQLMESLFDFDEIRSLFKSGFRMIFDAMHAVTGPYAEEIFEKKLHVGSQIICHGNVLSDFGGCPPDPNPVNAKEFYNKMMSVDAPDFGAASDGDGDRNMIMGKEIFVSPSDSLAILAANAHLTPAWKTGIKGIARSMPTSRAADRVAARMGVDLYETPTGWKFFSNLINLGKVSLCGEESSGSGSNHVNEKDGLWAVLFWLNILAVRRKSVKEIVQDHWKTYGRDYYSRHDYAKLDPVNANALMENLSHKLSSITGKVFKGMKVIQADNFSYHDPVDGSVSQNQGIRIVFEEGGRFVFRLSGTETSGATLRVYIEKFEPDPLKQNMNTQEILSDLIETSQQIACINHFTDKKTQIL